MTTTPHTLATRHPGTRPAHRSLNVPSLIGRLVGVLVACGAEPALLTGYDVGALVRIGLKSGLVTKPEMRAYLTM